MESVAWNGVAGCVPYCNSATLLWSSLALSFPAAGCRKGVGGPLARGPAGGGPEWRDTLMGQLLHDGQEPSDAEGADPGMEEDAQGIP